MLSVPRLEMQVRIFGALADPIRIKILLLLSDGERCVCEILPAFERSQSTISKHLSILYNAGLLDRRIEGNRTIYSIKNRRVVELLETADAIAIAHLSSLVESEGD
ncbi:MAG: winged helix-turn-helix transcriptional regulator [Methanothrix sp.]|jgi:ArsR family transcriptional regulator|nr:MULTISPECIES: metalloregulator ArsR/SmtB family transcription factor [Methanothrix]MBC7078889.1 winged helix-turn-helix transcriptional regulator [Methanothrix sp.]NPU87049.1 winged helix-turn-helix transcriptional regulator [Methanothrix sp.]